MIKSEPSSVQESTSKVDSYKLPVLQAPGKSLFPGEVSERTGGWTSQSFPKTNESLKNIR